jgi:hypothetical protein
MKNEAENIDKPQGNRVLPCVSGSALPEGFKVYKCTDCQTINVLKDNSEITVGFCSNCEHPLWND